MVKNPLAMWETWVGPWVGKICWRRAWQSTPVSLPGEFHWQRSLMGCRPWGHKKSDTTQRLSTAHNTHITQTWGERTIRFGLGHRGPNIWTLVGETRYYDVNFRNFPGGPVVENLPANAGDTGLIPCPETLCAPGKLSPWATTTESTCHNYWSLHAREPCSEIREAIARRSLRTATRESPLIATTREIPCTATMNQHNQKKESISMESIW